MLGLNDEIRSLRRELAGVKFERDQKQAAFEKTVETVGQLKRELEEERKAVAEQNTYIQRVNSELEEVYAALIVFPHSGEGVDYVPPLSRHAKKIMAELEAYKILMEELDAE